MGCVKEKAFLPFPDLGFPTQTLRSHKRLKLSVTPYAPAQGCLPAVDFELHMR